MSGKPPVEKLYVTLRKGFAGKPKFLKEMLRTLGFHRCYETVEVKNYPSVRGMVERCLHLVEVETDDQYYERKKREAARLAPRPPVRVTHAMPYWLQYLPAENQKVTNIYDKDYFWEVYGKSRRYLEPDFVDKLKLMDKERAKRKEREEAEMTAPAAQKNVHKHVLVEAISRKKVDPDQQPA
eukprot:TRINITY_DN9312_c1_g3_i1.p2 TRINITY_DN9312_c1_g3~~TRINITY_DN9312_c1_g3_i1.p2  ORF type:complete len:210 (-),score=29.55 TRINITY_DN9312_c1_g3_i1:737-1282(-)